MIWTKAKRDAAMPVPAITPVNVVIKVFAVEQTHAIQCSATLSWMRAYAESPSLDENQEFIGDQRAILDHPTSIRMGLPALIS
jgi:hypothetical protein